MSSSKLINVFKIVPKELFRLNNGRVISLRDRLSKRSRSYDLLTEAGKVKPKALQPASYTAPNGASMRPNTAFQRQLVTSFKGDNVVVYAVPAGTPLPEELLLVHEHTDHYSLQAGKEMTITELNTKITEFLEANGRVMSKDEWLLRYPEPTETYQQATIQQTAYAYPTASTPAPQSAYGANTTTTATPQQAPTQQSTTSSVQWVLDENAQKYKYWDGHQWVWQ